MQERAMGGTARGTRDALRSAAMRTGVKDLVTWAVARLYLDAGRNADRALELATKNLKFKRDRSAMETLEAARRAVERSEEASPSP
jgi:hypothetical protein